MTYFTEFVTKLTYILENGSDKEVMGVDSILLNLVPDNLNVMLVMLYIKTTFMYKHKLPGRKTLVERAKKKYHDKEEIIAEINKHP